MSYFPRHRKGEIRSKIPRRNTTPGYAHPPRETRNTLGDLIARKLTGKETHEDH